MMKRSSYFLPHLLSCGLLAFSFTAFAQVSVQWDKTYGGGLHELLRISIPTEDGGYLLAGISGIDVLDAYDEVGLDKTSFRVVRIDSVGNKLWDETYGGDDTESFVNVIPAADGGYLLAGDSDSNASGDKSGDSKGETDYWIIRIDSSGNKLWDKTIGSAGYDDLTRTIATADGGYLLAGTSSGDASGDKSEDSRDDNQFSRSDYWIVKVDANGNIQWDKTIGGNDYEFLHGVITTMDGGYLLAGYSPSNASGDKSEDSKGNYDYWIVKVDASGNKLWDKTYGGDDAERLENIIAASDGNYLLIGNSLSDASGDKSEDSRGGINCSEEYNCYPDYWIVKVDVNGNKQWDKTIGSAGYDDLTRTIATADGGYLLEASSSGNASGDKSEDSKGNSDYWIIKLDAGGNKLWDKTLGGNGIDYLSSVIITEDGGYLLGGFSYSNASGDKSEDAKGEFLGPTSDYWIIRTDSMGNKLWDKTLGGESWELLSSMNAATDGGYLLAGSSRSGATGNKSEDSNGGNDFWVIKVNETTPEEFSVKSFTLVDAETDEDIQELKDGDVINLAATGSVLLNVRVNTVPQTVDHIQMHISGPIVPHDQTERTLPYALYGDDMQGDYHGKRLRPGQYTLTATPYSKDKAGIPRTISFQVVNNLIVQSFTLVNVQTDEDIQVLTNGDVISLAATGNIAFAVRATTSPATVDHIQFELDGPIVHAQRERQLPYALYGDDMQGHYYGQRWSVGSYTLTATPYSRVKKGKAFTIAFQVVWQASDTLTETAAFQVYPIPTAGEVHVASQHKQARLLLLDDIGNVLLTKQVPQQAEQILDLSSFGRGTYYIKLINKEAVETKRIVVE